MLDGRRADVPHGVLPPAVEGVARRVVHHGLEDPVGRPRPVLVYGVVIIAAVALTMSRSSGEIVK
jgi:hypothetical protein